MLLPCLVLMALMYSDMNSGCIHLYPFAEQYCLRSSLTSPQDYFEVANLCSCFLVLLFLSFFSPFSKVRSPEYSYSQLYSADHIDIQVCEVPRSEALVE